MFIKDTHENCDKPMAISVPVVIDVNVIVDEDDVEVVFAQYR